jgi:2-dehydro-3-deoxyphosphogluconate aldolase/(4S)-4-hydroxy-2-oxoglutarate aldolase
LGEPVVKPALGVSMDRREILEKFKHIGIIPVVRTDTEESVPMAVDALLAGGIPIVEITMTIPNAVEMIEKISRRFGEAVTVGAGTVTDIKMCKQALRAGSRFLVTPVVNFEIISFCSGRNTAVICGGLSPTEILSAWDAGADAVKVFPIEAVGGPEYIRMIR